MKSGGAPIDGTVGGMKGAEVSGFIGGGTDGVFELGGGAPIEKGLCCCNDGVDVDGGAEVGGGGSSGFNDAAGGPDNEELLALLEGLGGVPRSLGGVTDPAPKIEGEEEAEEETPKKEEAAKDGIAVGGFNAGKVEELPRKLPAEKESA